MVVAWIVAVWLLSLALFVALRAHATGGNRTPGGRPGRSGRSAHLPRQRETGESRARLTDRG